MPLRSDSENFALIRVIGVGGGGSNAVNRMIRAELMGVEFIAVNTDAQALLQSDAPNKIRIGDKITRGLGAGGDPEVGYAAAEEGIEEIRKAIEGAQMVFLCVGLGGGTGSGAARIVASLAREQKSLVVAFATLPFAFVLVTVSTLGGSLLPMSAKVDLQPWCSGIEGSPRRRGD